MKTLDELLEMAKVANGRAKNRTIGKAEAEILLGKIAAAGDDTHTIRVYSRQGFVANSYKWRAEIRYFQASKQVDGQWIITATSGDAKRSYGYGALVTVNGRAG
jgi:hypothetical protein